MFLLSPSFICKYCRDPYYKQHPYHNQHSCHWSKQPFTCSSPALLRRSLFVLVILARLLRSPPAALLRQAPPHPNQRSLGHDQASDAENVKYRWFVSVEAFACGCRPRFRSPAGGSPFISSLHRILFFLSSSSSVLLLFLLFHSFL